VGLPFTWLGMVLAISFLETPLKFAAAGITLPLGLGIGRLVFGALNIIELAFATTLVVLVVRRSRVWRSVQMLLGGVCATLLVQVAVLRPVLDERTLQVIAGTPPPPAPWHLAYIALEVVKVAVLAALGVTIARLTPARGEPRPDPPN
jgi:hypothetical protein